jgi:hypothetical protein
MGWDSIANKSLPLPGENICKISPPSLSNFAIASEPFILQGSAHMLFQSKRALCFCKKQWLISKSPLQKD